MSEALPERTRDETDVGWGEAPSGPEDGGDLGWAESVEPADDEARLRGDRPPHHDRT